MQAPFHVDVNAANLSTSSNLKVQSPVTRSLDCDRLINGYFRALSLIFFIIIADVHLHKHGKTCIGKLYVKRDVTG